MATIETRPARRARQDGYGAQAVAGLLLVTTVVTGLMAGFFFAYACSVMVGLARTDDATFITTMQWINATVRNVYFGPVFFGALGLTVASASVAVVRRHRGRWHVVAAAALYAAAFVVTMGVSVPLNEQLAAAGPVAQMSDPAAVRAGYEQPWTTWNTVRTCLSTAALAAMCMALLEDRRTAQAGGPLARP